MEDGEEAVRWVIENSEDIGEVLGTYESVKELQRSSALPRWQQELQGVKINPESFYRHGDRNLATTALRRGWLSKDGRSIDEVAHDLSNYGVEVSPQDIVDFMLENPSGRVRQKSSELDALGQRFSELATKSAGVKIGKPESSTGRLFIENMRTSNNMEQLREQIDDARRAEEEVLRSIAEQRDAERESEQQTKNTLFQYFDGSLSELISKAKEGVSGVLKKIVAPISKRLQVDLASQGLDITSDYNHILDNSAIRHIINGHGSKSEEKRGQVQITDGDFERIEDIVDNYDEVNVEQGKSQASRIVYSKSYPDGTTIFVEEQRTGRKELAAVTMWKQKKAALTDAKSNTTPPISDLNGLSDVKYTEDFSETQEPGEDAEKIRDAEKNVDLNPTDAQKEAGNYRKGHIRLDGYDITIENPKGSERSGVDANGNRWSNTMNNTYGYIRGTKGVDGDHIDVFLSDSPQSGNVYVVDQVNEDGTFDEHKVMYGFDSMEEAKDAYLANYSPGWRGLGAITEVSKDEFRKWVDSSKRKTKPFSEYKSVKKDAGENQFEEPTIDYKPMDGKVVAYKHSGNLPQLGDGEFSLVERQFRENGYFNFSGGMISSSDDVAYIFRNLEDGAVENCFAVLVNSGNPTIIHLGMGGFDMTIANLGAVRAAYDAFGADEIYLVHNHPSGTLKASIPDFKLLNDLKKMFPAGVVQPGIIINLRSGKYGVFEDGYGDVANRPDKIQTNERDLKVLEFDKQVFSRDFDVSNLQTIRDSDDVAKFISSQRLGTREKMGVIVLNKQNNIVGNFHLPYGNITEDVSKLGEDLASLALRFGGSSVIPYGNFRLEGGPVRNLRQIVEAKSGKTITLLDAISVENGLRTVSANDEGLMEIGTDYGNRKDDVRFREMENYTPEEQEIIDRAKENGSYMKAPNGNPSNLNEKQWAQVRTKAFKDWFGDWELPTKIVNIVSAMSKHGFKNFADARDWAKKNIVRTLSNEETGNKGEIRISNTAIDKFLSQSSVEKSENKDVHLAVLKVLPDVIRESVDVEQHPDYKKGDDGVRRKENGENEDVTIHRLYGSVGIDGNIYRVKITLKEDTRNTKLPKGAYSYEATKIELFAGTLGKPDGDAPSTNNSISVAKLLQGVNKSNSDEEILNSSKVVDENGEPRVVYHGTTQDKATNIDKEKALHFIEALQNHPGTTIKNKELSDAVKVVKKHKNPTVLEGEISSAIDELSDELGVKVNKVKSRKELPEGIQRKMRGGRYPGLFDPKTGEVYVVMDEITDAEDAQATMLHEIVGHKGIRWLFGDKLGEFTNRVLDAMPADERKEWVEKYNGDEQLAAEEYVARFAEGYENPTMWEKVKAVIRDLLRDLGIDLRLSDNDLKYVLWKGVNGMKQDGTFMKAAEYATKDREAQRVLFREAKEDEEFADKHLNLGERIQEAFQAGVYHYETA